MVTNNTSERFALVIDTETTGLDFERDDVIEVGAALLHVTSRVVVKTYSTLLPSVSNAAEAVNGIPAFALSLTVVQNPILDPLMSMWNAASWICAHNADFDKKMLSKTLHTLAVAIPERPWVCTASHIKYPKGSCKRLGHLALDHGIFHSNAHRAMADVLTLCNLLQQVSNLEEQLNDSLVPRKTYAAVVTYEMRHVAKEQGFRFCGDSRQWKKDLTEAEVRNLPFEVVLLDSNED